MRQPKNYISETAATETLQRWLEHKPGADMLTLEEIYVAANRDSFDETTNRNWFNNKLSQLKYHNLVKSTKEFDKASKRHKTSGIQLTITGKKALGLIDGDELSMNEGDTPVRPAFKHGSLNDVAEAVKEFQTQNPEFEVMFDVKFKGVKTS